VDAIILVPDHELVSRFIQGDQSALDELINRHKNKIYTYILLTVKKQQLAEDIFQDTFIKIIKSLLRDRYKDNGKFVPWAMRIAHNLIIDHYRREKQLQVISNDNYETDLFNNKSFADKSIEDELVSDQITEDIRKLIDLLPSDQREVVLLRHYAGLSFKEIAEQTEVSINTALGRMRYALINLRKMIQENNMSLIN